MFKMREGCGTPDKKDAEELNNRIRRDDVEQCVRSQRMERQQA